MGDLENPVESEKPDSELTQWRLRSRSCAVADMTGAAAGISLYAVAGIDSVVSWPSNQVLLSDPDLSRVATVRFAPPFLWLIASAGMVPGRTRYWRLSQLPAWSRACFVAAAVVCAAVIAGGFVLGAAKGAVRVLPGPRYQVSVIGNSQTGWTTVPAESIPPLASQFRSRRRVLHVFRASCRHSLHRPAPSAPRSHACQPVAAVSPGLTPGTPGSRSFARKRPLTWENRACQAPVRHEPKALCGEQLQRVGRQLLHREVKTRDIRAPLPLPDLCVTALKPRSHNRMPAKRHRLRIRSFCY
jgi:hypothetical protein